jgi:hypothetical protein
MFLAKCLWQRQTDIFELLMTKITCILKGIMMYIVGCIHLLCASVSFQGWISAFPNSTKNRLKAKKKLEAM